MDGCICKSRFLVFSFKCCVHESPHLLSVHVCECVQGWLPSLCLPFVAWARALRLPRGHHCPRSPQPSGHRCSPIDTMLLTHTPHLSRCVGGQARRPVACHAIGHSLPARDAARGGSHCVCSFNPATMNNGKEVAPSEEEIFT